MVFSDTPAKLGLVQDCEMNVFGNYGDITGNSDRLYDFTARLNRSYDKASALAMSVDGKWRYDDTNYTDFPVGSTSLVSGQKDYSLSVEHLDILKATCLDSSGNTVILQPYDLDDSVGYLELTELSNSGGIPTHYRKFGGSVVLYPTPNYAYTDGLTIYYQRKPSYFVYTDTTKPAGLPILFHRYLSLDASLDYAISNQLSCKNDLAVKLKEFENLYLGFMADRAKDAPKFIKSVFRSSR